MRDAGACLRFGLAIIRSCQSLICYSTAIFIILFEERIIRVKMISVRAGDDVMQEGDRDDESCNS